MNREDFIKELKKINIVVTDDMMNNLDMYLKFLIEYNSHTNLTAIKEEKEIYVKHFYDSLTIVKVINLNNIDTLLDIGTGAGFPGMVLKIFYPNLKVTLLDSNNKKIRFLQELRDRLGIEVNLINERVEDYSKNNLNKFDIVTSRAVANLRVLSELSLPLVKNGGYFIPMKANIEEELKEASATINVMYGKIKKIESFNLLDMYGIRNILLIEKIGETKFNDLRKYDKILKKPLKILNK